jgi:hypothetical protein
MAGCIFLTRRSIGDGDPPSYVFHMKKLPRLIPRRSAASDAEKEARLRCDEQKAAEIRAESDRGEAMSHEGLREFMEALERGDAVPSFPRRR